MGNTSTRTPEYSQITIVKPVAGFEEDYDGLNVSQNPIAIPGGLDQFAGKNGYDPNLLAGIPVPMGAKIFVWLPRFFPAAYGDGTSFNYRYRLIWRLRSLVEQVQDPEQKRPSHFGQLLPGVAQEETDSANPDQVALNPTAGPRVIIPSAFETVQIVNNKFSILDVDGTQMPVQKGTTGATGDPIVPQTQDPADIAVVAARANTYIGPDQYQAPLSPNYPGTNGGKLGAAGLISQGIYPDQAGWASTTDARNQGYSAGPSHLPYGTEVKGDELIILLDRLDIGGSNPEWDFEGFDRNVSRIFGTDNGTRPRVEGLGAYIVTGSSVTDGANFT